MVGRIFFHLLIVVAGVYGIIRGFRSGLLSQISSVVAVAFAIVAAYIFGGDVEDWLWEYFSSWDSFNARFVAATLAAIIIFIPVYFIMKICLWPLAKMMKAFPSGILDSLGGAVFRLFKYLLFLSMAYNLIVDFQPRSALATSSKSHDGNLVEGVVKLAPALMGFPGGEEVSHYQQLEDAKKIS